ncbi:MAG: hypothetical protein V1754_13020 [Pseudomonadota bacterium]
MTNQGEDTTKWFRPILVFSVIAAIGVHVFWASQPLSPFLQIVPDDGHLLEAVSRAYNGQGLTSALNPSDDLAKLEHQNLFVWPPGPAGLLLGIRSLGLDLEWTYKLLWLFLFVVGTAGWVFFARSFLSRLGLIFFSIAIIVGGFGLRLDKLGDVMLWAVMGYYFLLLYRSLFLENVLSFRRLLAVGCLVMAGVFAWYGAVVLAAAGALAVFCLGKGSFVRRVGGAIAVVVPALIVFIGLRALNIYMGGQVPYSVSVFGFSWENLPLSHLLVPLKILVCELFGMWSLLEKIARAIGLGTHMQMLLVVGAIGMTLLLVHGVWRGIFPVNYRKLLWVLLIHFGLLFVFLAGLSLFFKSRFFIEAGINFTVLASDRYWMPLLLAFALIWLGLLSGWWKQVRKESKIGRALVFAITICFVVGIAYFGLRNAKWIWQARSEVALQQEVVDYVRNSVETQGFDSHRIMDLKYVSHLWQGKLQASRLLEREELKQTKNTKKTYVLVVVRGGISEEVFVPQPKRLEGLAQHAADVLNLKLQKTFADGRIKIYGGWVDPYPKGGLAL